MRAEIEFDFRGQWINMPVEFEFSEMDGEVTIDTVTYHEQEILDLLEEGEVEYLKSLAHKRMIYRRMGAQLIASERRDYFAQVREAALLGDMVANNSGIR